MSTPKSSDNEMKELNTKLAQKVSGQSPQTKKVTIIVEEKDDESSSKSIEESKRSSQ